TGGGSRASTWFPHGAGAACSRRCTATPKPWRGRRPAWSVCGFTSNAATTPRVGRMPRWAWWTPSTTSSKPKCRRSGPRHPRSRNAVGRDYAPDARNAVGRGYAPDARNAGSRQSERSPDLQLACRIALAVGEGHRHAVCAQHGGELALPRLVVGEAAAQALVVGIAAVGIARRRIARAPRVRRQQGDARLAIGIAQQRFGRGIEPGVAA